MLPFPEYESYDGLGLARLVRSGAMSAGEVLEACLARIEARNPAINAVVQRLDGLARDSLAGLPAEASFSGVPFLLKDLYSFLEGAPCESGCRLFAGFVSRHDDEMVRRYKAAGLVMAGKTATSEFGLSVATESAFCGPTRNPWDLERSPGGSSGGSAAAVAAGLLPLANASDGGGSIRIPAAHCGLFGLKPTRARNPSGEGWAGLATHHAVTRSVRDSAALLDATRGYAPGYPYAAPTPGRPFLEEVGAPPGRLRVAWSAATPAGIEVHPDCREAVERAAALAVDLGHEVEEADPEFDYERLGEAVMTVVTANTAAALEAGRPGGAGPARREQVEKISWLLAEEGRDHSALDYVRALDGLKAIRMALAGFFADYDALLTPTTAQPAPAIGVFATDRLERDPFIELTRPYVYFTQPFNITGQPAASLPLHWDGSGFPIGVQLVTRFGDEATLLRLAAQFEQARPWFDRQPALAAEGLA